MDSRLRRYAWGTAVATWGLGDLVTTAYGLERAGATEQNETGQAVIQETGYGGMAVWKAVAIGAFFGLEAVVPEPHSVGVPVGLATLGVGTVLYNTSVIAQLEQ